jgi:hypothetical protein
MEREEGQRRERERAAERQEHARQSRLMAEKQQSEPGARQHQDALCRETAPQLRHPRQQCQMHRQQHGEQKRDRAEGDAPRSQGARAR